MDVRQAIGLFGIVLAAIEAQLNDAVLNTVLPDIGGALGIGTDLTSWLRTLFITGEVIGMCSSPSLGLGFSFRRFALFAVALSTFPTLLMMFGIDEEVAEPGAHGIVGFVEAGGGWWLATRTMSRERFTELACAGVWHLLEGTARDFGIVVGYDEPLPIGALLAAQS